jgi:hypothetical protein
MKKLKYKIIVPGGLLFLITLFACSKDFLNKTPLGAFSSAAIANKTGVQAVLIGAYHLLNGQGAASLGYGNSWGAAPSNWVYGSVDADDSYKGSTPSDQGDITPLETWAYNTNNPYPYEKWRVMYEGAQRANEVLRLMTKAADMTDAEKKATTGEVRFLRGYYHFEVKRIFNYVPYVDETITVANGNGNVSNIDASGNFIDIWPKIEADFQFAMDNLPETQPQAGRANKWAAAAYLAKAYMYEHKYAQAKTLFDQIIASGKTANGKPYALVNFESNFNAANDNSAESIFAVQNSVNDGSAAYNSSYGDNLNMPNGGIYGCCGFNNPSISLANAYKTDAVTGLPLLDGSYNTGKNVSDPTPIVAGTYTYGNKYTGTLDPRIDWTIGRPGLPYFDMVVPTDLNWIRDPSTDGYMNPKKNVYAKSQSGTFSSTESSFWGPTQADANNTNLMRFADVLLMAAEAEVEVGDVNKALAYVNQVRTRAADVTGWVYKNSAYDAASGKYTTQTTPADNYLIKTYPAGAFTDKNYARQAIMFERRLELGMEGHRFFDLQRWDNGSGTIMAPALNAYATVEKTRPSPFSVNTGATFTAQKNEYYPIPQNVIDVSNSGGTVVMKQNPKY